MRQNENTDTAVERQPDQDAMSHAPSAEPPTARDQWLLYVADMDRLGFCVAFSCRLYQRRDADALVSVGHLRVTSAVVCDGDGHPLEPERYRNGYELTESGRVEVDRLRQRGAAGS